MLECKSMYFGGEIISALDLGLDYDSYREMGLLCPFCNEPVYLCGETVRQNSKTGRLSYIQPHFRHFPGGDPLDLTCEKRYLSPEGKRYLDALRSERKGQRLDLFNRYLWEMLFPVITTSRAVKFLKEEIRRASKGSSYDYQFDFQRNVDRLTCWFKDNHNAHDVISRHLLQNPEGFFNEGKDGRDAYRNSIEERAAFLKASIDVKVHLLIVQEVCAFLGTKSAKEFLYYFSAWFWGSEISRGLTQGLTLDEILFQKNSLTSQTFLLLMEICCCNWQQQLEEKAKLKESTRAKGFAKKS